MDNIKWIKSMKPGYRPSDTNVHITSSNNKTRIRFFDESDSEISNDQTIMVGVAPDTLYFKDGLGVGGFKVRSASRSIFIPAFLGEWVDGYYLLKRGKDDIFYIELKDKKTREEKECRIAKLI